LKSVQAPRPTTRVKTRDSEHGTGSIAIVERRFFGTGRWNLRDYDAKCSCDNGNAGEKIEVVWPWEFEKCHGSEDAEAVSYWTVECGTGPRASSGCQMCLISCHLPSQAKSYDRCLAPSSRSSVKWPPAAHVWTLDPKEWNFGFPVRT
jgi:hypothetical protein